MLAAVAEAHGLPPLIKAGQHLTRVPPDPAVAALLAATSPEDLFARWSRLERFVHSRHRVVVRDVGEHHLVAEHVSTTDEPPLSYEDALILGVLVAALSAVGAVGVAVRLGSGPGAPLVVDSGETYEPDADHPTALWRFSWLDFVRDTAVPELTSSSDATAGLRRLVACDPARGWTLAEAAATLCRSKRSLQRALEPSGGFAAVVAAVRTERASDLLINADHPLSVVGFACGYADQPHFTREFKRRTATTPAAYRRDFAAGRVAS